MRSIEERTGAAMREPSPLQALAFVWRGRWLVASCAILAASIGVFVAEQRGTIWRTKSVLYVERQSPMLPGGEVSHWLQSRNYANTQAALLRSTPVLQAGLAQPGIESSPMFGDSDNHLAWLRKRLSVAVGTEDDLITVTLESEAVEDACLVVNAVVDAYIERHSQSQHQTAGEVLIALRRELERYEAELRTVQQEQIAFLEQHPGVSLGDAKETQGASRLRELNLALTQAELAAMESSAQLRAAKCRAEATQPILRLPMPGIDDATMRQSLDVQAQIDELLQQRLRMLATMTPEHPEVQRLEGTIARQFELANAIAERITTAHIASLEQRQLGQRRLCDDLLVRIRDEEQRLRNIDPAIAEFRGLEIRFDRAHKLADALYERVRGIDINENLGNSEQPPRSSLVYEYATPAGAVVAASKTSLAAICGFVGVLLGLALAFGRSIVWPRVHSAADLPLDVPVLGALPKVRMAAGGMIATLGRRKNLEAALQSLRAVLHFGARAKRYRTLQIVGLQRGAGASATTAGLGIASAQAGQRTLIVDADFGQQTQCEYFGLDGSVGLRQVLAQQLPVATAIQATALPGLFVLPAGAIDGSVGVLDAAALPTLLQQLASQWDRVLVDSPALLQAVDARILAAVCDASLLVLRPGASTVGAVQAAQDAVAAVAGQVVGVVFRGASRSQLRSERLHSAQLLALPSPDVHSVLLADQRRVGEQA